MPSGTLTPAAFHILLALAERDLHGLGIADWVERETGGAVDLGPGTLYRSLRDLADRGLAREAAPPDDETDTRRKYYAITSEGRRELRAEASRLERLVAVARELEVLPRRAR